ASRRSLDRSANATCSSVGGSPRVRARAVSASPVTSPATRSPRMTSRFRRIVVPPLVGVGREGPTPRDGSDLDRAYPATPQPVPPAPTRPAPAQKKAGVVEPLTGPRPRRLTL